MPIPSQPVKGSTDWYLWASALHQFFASQPRHVVHGGDPNVARPDVTVPVIWYGTVEPNHSDDTLDVFVPISDA